MKLKQFVELSKNKIKSKINCTVTTLIYLFFFYPVIVYVHVKLYEMRHRKDSLEAPNVNQLFLDHFFHHSWLSYVTGASYAHVNYQLRP